MASRIIKKAANASCVGRSYHPLARSLESIRAVATSHAAPKVNNLGLAFHILLAISKFGLANKAKQRATCKNKRMRSSDAIGNVIALIALIIGGKANIVAKATCPEFTCLE